LVRLGWSHGDQEVFSRREICDLFDLSAVHRSSAQIDLAKFSWLNQHYLKEMPRDELIQRLLPFLESAVDGKVEVTEGLAQLVDLLRERSKTLREMAQQARFLVCDAISYEEKAARKHLKPEAAPVLRDLRRALDDLASWTVTSIEGAFDEVGGRLDLNLGKLAQPVRVAVTGGAVSPGIHETLAALGRERSLARIDAAIAFIAAD
jgi:glutamyl-tRNA synthetase